MIEILVLPLAIILDLILGEPPANLHPVVGMGKVISFGVRIGPKSGKTFPFIYGGAVVLVTMAAFGLPAYFVLKYARLASPALYLLISAILLKSCFSLRELVRAASRVRTSLAEDRLADARRRLSGLVSRDTSSLNTGQVAAAVVESVAENTSDSFVAPVLFYLVFGVAGAVAYRVCNTADAMIGYRGRFEFFGKLAARLDDALNLVPARISAALIVLASYLGRADWKNAWHVLRRDHALTESPNAGWPMSAMAGALNVALEKVGHYRLGDGGCGVTEDTIGASVKIMVLATSAWSAISFAVKGVLVAVAPPA
ncbi:MAG: cobalamin biosynthesis protein [Chloroflexi bacterium]|nr:cobalamin biosynthesis protein [Chloroflexota bacterium]